MVENADVFNFSISQEDMEEMVGIGTDDTWSCQKNTIIALHCIIITPLFTLIDLCACAYVIVSHCGTTSYPQNSFRSVII